ncbi:MULTISPECIES: hypothetical protein [unclassified Brevundimonas]|jgi:hypothetical protein
MKRVNIKFTKKGFVRKESFKKGETVSVLPCIAKQKVEVEKVAKYI